MSDTINFTIDDILNPQGRNGLSAYAAYYQRLLYKEEIYPPVNYGPLDTWYDKMYYGKIDTINNSIAANFNKMSPIENNLYTFDFVAAQYKEFVEKMAAALATGACIDLNGNPKVYRPKAVRAYEDPRVKYGAAMQTIYDAFVRTLDPTTDKIRNFSDFVKFFVGFLLEIAKQVPITLTNFILGSEVGLFDTGLCIALDNGNMGDDNYKYENWLTDPNYNFYVSLAKATGFIINKNVPWVLTAELFSQQSLDTLSTYTAADGTPITKENFFDHYYTKTFLLDVRLLQEFLVRSWAQFVELRPFYEERTLSNRCGKFRTDLVNRATSIDPSVLSDKFMIDFYLALRQAEANDPVQISAKFKNELYAIYRVRPRKNLSGVLNSASYINTVYRDYIYSGKYHLLNESFEKDLDKGATSGNLLTVGSLIQQIY
tara:strand:+ start:3016 stop:4302 length:1287 start_codon:yes stop_codon:yes gene_type:complete